MQKNKINIVMIGLESLHELTDFGHRSRMIASALSKSHKVEKVIIIHSPISLIRRIKEKSYGTLKDKYSLKKKQLFINQYDVNDKLSIIQIKSVIPERIAFLSYLERIIIAKKIKHILEKELHNNYSLIIDNPRIIGIAKRLDAKICFFDMIDNLLIHPQMKRYKNKIKKAYSWVDQNADNIFIASEKQMQLFNKKEKIRILPNGVDDIFFETKINNSNNDITCIPHPIIGYVGSIQERINSELLLDIITKLPHYNFVFIGPIISKKSIEKLESCKNVYFLGSKPFNDIPSYISKFDVAIIPHRINEFTDSMNPLKIYEYIACGKPVVTTSIEGISQFKHLIYIADNTENFINSIEMAIIATKNNTQAMDKNKFLKLYSWNSICKKIIKCIEELDKA